MQIGFIEFLKAMGTRWLTLVSGAVSVPFTIAGLVLGEHWQGTLFLSLGLLCFAIASYFTWKAERERGDALDQRLQPRLQAGEPVIAIDHDPIRSQKQRFYVRIAVASKTEATITGCQGFLTRVSRQEARGLPWNSIWDGAKPCLWSHNRADTADILPGHKLFLNVVAATESMQAARLRPEIVGGDAVLEMALKQTGVIYRFHLQIGAKDAPPCAVAINVDLTTPSTYGMTVGI